MTEDIIQYLAGSDIMYRQSKHYVFAEETPYIIGVG